MIEKPNKRGGLFLLGALALALMAGCQTTQSVVRGSPKADPEKLAEAKETLRQVPTVNDRVAEDFYQQGLAFEEEGLAREAVGEYLKALKLKPSFSHQVNTQLGMLYLETGQFDLAVYTLCDAVAMNPGSALAYCALGRASAAKGETSRALNALYQAIRINPDFTDAHYQAGQILWKNDRALAAGHFRRVLELTQDVSRTEEIRNLLNQLPLQGEPIAAHQMLPPQKAALIFRV